MASCSRFLTLLLVVASAACWADNATPTTPEPEEGAPILFAHELIDPARLQGEHYRVLPVVEVENFSYVFHVQSDYGSFEKLGVANTLACIHEIEAINQLNAISQTQAFTRSLSDRLRDPVMMTVGIARRPVSTVVGLPMGIGRYLQNKIYEVRRGSERAWTTIKELDDEKPAKEKDEEKSTSRKVIDSTGKLSRKYLGYDDAKRSWAKRLGVDPYSDNVALQQALGRISWASSLGDFAGDFAAPSTDAFSYAGKAQELVWDRSPIELERTNIQALKKLGVNKDLIKRFTDSDAYSLTEKTSMTLSLAEMDEASGIEPVIELALKAATRDEAIGFCRTFDILASYDSEVASVVELSIRRGLITAKASNDYLIMPLPVDYLHWTPLISDPLLSEEFDHEKREVWVSGTVSPIAAERLRAWNWHVFDNCLDPNRHPTAAARRYAPARPKGYGSPSRDRAASL